MFKVLSVACFLLAAPIVIAGIVLRKADEFICDLYHRG